MTPPPPPPPPPPNGLLDVASIIAMAPRPPTKAPYMMHEGRERGMGRNGSYAVLKVEEAVLKSSQLEA